MGAAPRVSGDGGHGGAPARARILIVAPEPFFEERGTPIALRHVLHAYRQLGYEVDMLTFPVGQRLQLPGVRFFRTPNPLGFRSVPIGLSWKKVVLDALLWPMLWARLRREHYVCIHAVEEAALMTMLLGHTRASFVTYDMQSSLPEQLSRRALFRSRPLQALGRGVERWLLRRVQYVVCSAGLEDHVRAIAPETPRRTWLFPSGFPASPRGADGQLREELGIPPDARVVLYSGSFADYQGLPILLDAIPRTLREVPDAFFVLVGAASDAEAASTRAAMAPACRDRMLVLRRQDQRQMPRFLAMATVVVSVRLHGRNIPLKVFDYLASGRAIVATDIECHRAVLDAELAVLVPPSGPELARGVAALLRDPGRAERLAASARRYAQEQLTREAFVRSLGEVLSLAEARGGANARATQGHAVDIASG